MASESPFLRNELRVCFAFAIHKPACRDAFHISVANNLLGMDTAREAPWARHQFTKLYFLASFSTLCCEDKKNYARVQLTSDFKRNTLVIWLLWFIILQFSVVRPTGLFRTKQNMWSGPHTDPQHWSRTEEGRRVCQALKPVFGSRSTAGYRGSFSDLNLWCLAHYLARRLSSSELLADLPSSQGEKKRDLGVMLSQSFGHLSPS